MPRTATDVDLGALLAGLGDREVDETDARILRAAGSVLVADGLDGFEVEPVVDGSGVGRSTIYRRFGDRNGLIAATLAHECRRLLAGLAESVASLDDPVEQVSAAFAAGLRHARSAGLVELIRSEPLLLRLLTVDGAPVVAAGREQLVVEAASAGLDVPEHRVRPAAELLVRLAISFVVTPESALDLDDDRLEATFRDLLAPLLAR